MASEGGASSACPQEQADGSRADMTSPPGVERACDEGSASANPALQVGRRARSRKRRRKWDDAPEVRSDDASHAMAVDPQRLVPNESKYEGAFPSKDGSGMDVS